VRRVVVIAFFVDVFLQNYFRGRALGVENSGISFGIGSGAWGRYSILIILGLVVGWFFYEDRVKEGGVWAFNLMAWGGLGNWLNRFYWGSVWDYISWPFLPFSFNLSDVLVCCGVISYILGINGNRNTLRGQGDFDHQQTGRFGSKPSGLG